MHRYILLTTPPYRGARYLVGLGMYAKWSFSISFFDLYGTHPFRSRSEAKEPELLKVGSRIKLPDHVLLPCSLRLVSSNN
jgi:hypothetical protein